MDPASYPTSEDVTKFQPFKRYLAEEIQKNELAVVHGQ
jgi:hypothetical protein